MNPRLQSDRVIADPGADFPEWRTHMRKLIIATVAVASSLATTASILAAAGASADSNRHSDTVSLPSVVNERGATLCWPKIIRRGWELNLDQPRVLHILCM